MSSAVTSSGNRTLEQLKVAELRDELKKRGLVQKGAKKDLLERLEEAMLKEGQLAFSLNPLDREVDTRLGEQDLGEFNAKPISTDGEGDDEQIPEVDPHCEQILESDSEIERKGGGGPEFTAQKRELERLGREEYTGDDDIRVSGPEIYEGHIAERESEHGLYNEVTKREEGLAEAGVRASKDSGLQSGLVELALENENPCSPTVAKDCLIQGSDSADASFSVANSCIGTNVAAGTCVANLDLHVTGQQIKVAEVANTLNSMSQDTKAEEMMHNGECVAEELQVENIVDLGDSRADDLMAEGVQSEDVLPGSTVSSSQFRIPQPLYRHVQSQDDDGERHSPAKVAAMVDIKVEEEYLVGKSEKDKSQSLEVSDQEFYPAGHLFPEAHKFQEKEEKPSVFKAAASIDIKLEEGYRVDRGEKDIPRFFEFGQEERDSKEHIPKVIEEEERATYNPLDEKLGYGHTESEQEVLGYVKSEQGVGDATKGLDVKIEPQAMELGEDMPENGYKPMETHSQAFTSQKRKEEEGESRHQEPAKRQRRWNSGNKLTVEATRPLTTGTIKEIISSDSKEFATSANTPRTTPKITATTRPPSTALKIDPFANGGRTRQRIVPPASRPPTNSLRIDRFLRPFTLKAVKELLSQTGFFSEFWMDQIKTHCYVMYPSVEEAIATRNALYDLQWPPSFGNTLVVDFVDPEEVKVRSEGHLEKSPALHAAGLTLPPAQSVMPSAPVTATRPISPLHHSPLTRENPALVPIKEPEPPILTLDDIFKKTKAKPHIYYLPLTEEEIVAKVAAKKEQQSSGHLIRA
eukprot:c29128_g2_i1 orf=285-2702(-)